MHYHSEIKQLIEAALIRQEVVLAGGEKSDYYYDIKKLLLEPQSLKMITEEMAYCYGYNLNELIGRGIRPKSIGGVETGSIPLITSLSFEMKVPGFYMRKKSKPYGLKKRIEGNLISPCILVEDVITTGHSLIETVDVIQKEHVEILAIISVVDRSKDDLQKLFMKKGVRYFTLYKHHDR